MISSNLRNSTVSAGQVSKKAILDFSKTDKCNKPLNKQPNLSRLDKCLALLRLIPVSMLSSEQVDF